jgi:hypothetical protein
MLTSVNDHGWSPQLLIVAVAEVELPTSRSPKSSVSSLAQKRPCAPAHDATTRPAIPSSRRALDLPVRLE